MVWPVIAAVAGRIAAGAAARTAGTAAAEGVAGGAAAGGTGAAAAGTGSRVLSGVQFGSAFARGASSGGDRTPIAETPASTGSSGGWTYT